MSKWIDKDEFENFKQEKKAESEKKPGINKANMWPTPKPGQPDEPKIYKLRFLPNKGKGFYKKYFYHMFQGINGGWVSVLCPKTYGFEEYCPFCSISNKLYNSQSETDKKMASKFKRKVKFSSNVFVVDDPEDASRQAEEKKTGKVLIYDIPGKVESKLDSQIKGGDDTIGMDIFSPGDDGYNFILKVEFTKAAADGKQFYNYDNSEFARKATPLGSDKEIEAIMDQLHDLDAYISGMKKSDDDILKILNTERLIGWVAEEMGRGNGIAVDTTPESKVNIQTEEKKEESKKDEQSDEDLLAELKNLK